MARINSTFFAGVTGKVHNVVISSWRGIPILKAAPAKRKKRKASKKQLEQREKLKIASSFLRCFGDIINFGFEPVEGQSARSQAQKIAMREAIRGEYPEFSLDMNRILITRGSLEPASEVVLSSSRPGEILFQWKRQPNSEAGGGDKCIMIVWREQSDRAAANLDGSARYEEQSVFDVKFLSGKKVHCWIAFRSADGLLKSNSVYAGEVTVKK